MLANVALFIFLFSDPFNICLGIILRLVSNQPELEGHLFSFPRAILQGLWASSFPFSALFSAHSAQSLLGKLDNLPEWKQEDAD